MKATSMSNLSLLMAWRPLFTSKRSKDLAQITDLWRSAFLQPIFGGTYSQSTHVLSHLPDHSMEIATKEAQTQKSSYSSRVNCFSGSTSQDQCLLASVWWIRHCTSSDANLETSKQIAYIHTRAMAVKSGGYSITSRWATWLRSLVPWTLNS